MYFSLRNQTEGKQRRFQINWIPVQWVVCRGCLCIGCAPRALSSILSPCFLSGVASFTVSWPLSLCSGPCSLAPQSSTAPPRAPGSPITARRRRRTRPPRPQPPYPGWARLWTRPLLDRVSLGAGLVLNREVHFKTCGAAVFKTALCCSV